MVLKQSLRILGMGGLLYLGYLVFFKFHYMQARIFLAVWLAFSLVVQVLFRNKKDLMKERSRPGPNVPKWDRILVLLFQLMTIVTFEVSAWDAGYTRLSPALPLGLYMSAYALLLGGLALSLWAMHTNDFFSSMVRIQKDRNQRVIDSGPYLWMRHPGYAGSMVTNVMIPLVLGSLWGLIPALLFVVVLWIRTAWEDVYLQEKLPGYKAYARKVGWRLVPKLW